MKTICAFCKSQSVMDQIECKLVNEGRSYIRWAAVFTCHNCRMYMVAVASISRDIARLRGTPAEHRAIAAADDYGTVHWYPKLSSAPDYNDTPAHIERGAAEAHVCLDQGQLIASAITARATIEAIAKHHGIKDRINLEKKIDALKDRQLIYPLLADQAHQIRLVGNDMAHGDFEDLPTKDEVTIVVDFMDMLIDVLYQQPAKLKLSQEQLETRRAGSA